MSEQIQLKWKRKNLANYAASMVALSQARPRPEITVSLRLKGTMPLEGLEDIMAIAKEYEHIDVFLNLTATWPDADSPEQLRLWEPPTARVEDDWRLPPMPQEEGEELPFGDFDPGPEPEAPPAEA